MLLPRIILSLLSLAALSLCIVPQGREVYIEFTTSASDTIYYLGLADPPFSSGLSFLSYATSISQAVLFTIDSTTNYVYIPATALATPEDYESGWGAVAGSTFAGPSVGTRQVIRDSDNGLQNFAQLACATTDDATGALSCADAGQTFQGWVICEYDGHELYSYNPTSPGGCGSPLLTITAFRAVVPPETASSSSSSTSSASPSSSILFSSSSSFVSSTIPSSEAETTPATMSTTRATSSSNAAITSGASSGGEGGCSVTVISYVTNTTFWMAEPYTADGPVASSSAVVTGLVTDPSLFGCMPVTSTFMM